MWATWKLENNYIQKVLPQEWDTRAPHQALQLWVSGIRRRGPQSTWLWRPVGLELRRFTGIGKQRFHSWRAHTKFHMQWDGTKQWLQRSLGQIYLMVMEDLLGKQGVVVCVSLSLSGVINAGGIHIREYSPTQMLAQGRYLAWVISTKICSLPQ